MQLSLDVVGLETIIKHRLNRLTKFYKFAAEKIFVAYCLGFQKWKHQFLKVIFFKLANFHRHRIYNNFEIANQKTV